MKNKIPIFFMLSLFLAACSKPVSEEIVLGYFEGNRYFNEYFGFQINFPNEWSIDQQNTDFVAENGADLLAITNQNEDMQAAALADEHVADLFAVFKFILGSPVDYNPSILCMAENLNSDPRTETGIDYLIDYKKIAYQLSAPLSMNFPKRIYTENLGGKDFDVLEAELNVGKRMGKQLYYVSIVKGYSLIIILSYSTEAEKSELLDVIKTIEFSLKK